MSTQEDKTSPALARLAARLRDEHFGYQKAVKKLERDHRKAERALESELYGLAGLKPGDKVLYEGEPWTVDSVGLPFLASDEASRTRVYVALRKPHNAGRVKLLHFDNDKEITKL